MKLTYDLQDKPRFSQTLVFAFQQMIAIMAATLLVPMLITSYGAKYDSSVVADPAAALFGAGIGTLIYILVTKKCSPVFLGSSFTFLGAYEAVIKKNYGFWGIIIGVALAGLVYVLFSILVKLVGSGWVNRLMPPVIIGPIVTLIGLSLSGTATGWMSTNGGEEYSIVTILIGIVTFLAIVITSIKGSKTLKLIPLIIGIGAGYAVAGICTIIGTVADIEMLKVMDITPLTSLFTDFSIESIVSYPKLFILEAVRTNGNFAPIDLVAIGNIALIFVPIGVVELAQHIADHKNLSSIIEKDLITDPGLDKTLLGDGVGSMVGTFFGCCANTTYGESVACVALTGNASIISIMTAGVGCMVLSFVSPFVALINTIPKCVMGGACIALYGFIAVSGLKMIKKVDLSDNKKLYVVSAILVTGIGGLTLNFGTSTVTGGALFTITSLAVAFIIGLITNGIVHSGKDKDTSEEE